jgi:DNA invertase Pin-like site-specific DNA recombinase
MKKQSTVQPLAASKRCAVYCRMSSNEGLDQEFNSIDAQRDASHAFVISQRAEGWIAVGDGYEPRLLRRQHGTARVAAIAGGHRGRSCGCGRYKIDRLSRSLADFARMVDVFDRHGVSFISVTQQFNTTTSMGRLTLNIPLSFAQFEREVTGKRIRDKFAAPKAKGLWMGGVVPLGYRVENWQLLIQPDEAKVVRRIFEKFAELRSTTEVVRWLRREGITSRKGCAFTRNALVKLLNNPMYRGEIAYKNKGKEYPGQHEALIAPELWNAVQAAFAENQRVHSTPRGIATCRSFCWRVWLNPMQARNCTPRSCGKKNRSTKRRFWRRSRRRFTGNSCWTTARWKAAAKSPGVKDCTRPRSTNCCGSRGLHRPWCKPFSRVSSRAHRA